MDAGVTFAFVPSVSPGDGGSGGEGVAEGGYGYNAGDARAGASAGADGVFLLVGGEWDGECDKVGVDVGVGVGVGVGVEELTSSILILKFPSLTR